MRVELDRDPPARIAVACDPDLAVGAGAEKPFGLVAGNLGRRPGTLETPLPGARKIFARLCQSLIVGQTASPCIEQGRPLGPPYTPIQFDYIVRRGFRRLSNE